LQCDIEKYFARVDHSVLMERLSRKVGDLRMLRLLQSLLAHGAEGPSRGMPIGNLTSQLFANVYLDALDHFAKEELRVRHYLRYMDDFLLLAGDRREARTLLAEVKEFLREQLRLKLNRRRIVLAPLCEPCDFLGYVQFGDERTRVRRRSVRRLWRRLPALAQGLASGRVSYAQARCCISSWFGLAKHADALQLSRAIFSVRDVANIGKRLLVREMSFATRP